MNSKEFSKIRHTLQKTQKQLAQLLCVSTKTIQSFEQGWRKIPAYIGREMLLLLTLKKSNNSNIQPCWDIINCSSELRSNCIVWELKARYFCWLLNGTLCKGKIHRTWEAKIKLCRKCMVYKQLLEQT